MNITALTHVQYLRQQVSPELALGAEKLFDQASGMAERYRMQAQHIYKSDRLTPSGQREEVAQVRKTFLAEVAKLEKEADGYRQNYTSKEAQLLANLRGKESPEDRMERLARGREIRDLLRAMPKIEVAAFYEEAIANGWWETAEAIESSPAGFHLAPPELIAKGKDARMRASDPALAQQVAQLKTVHETTTHVLKALVAETDRTLGIQDVPPPIRMAGEK